MLKKLSVGLMGYGQWGRQLARNLAVSPVIELCFICDPHEAARRDATSIFPQLPIFADPHDAAIYQHIDAIVIATPIPTLHHLIQTALKHGKHVLVEKPAVTNYAEAKQLCMAVEQSGHIVMVDYPPVYSSAIKQIKAFMTEETLGPLQYYESIRVHYGSRAAKTSVVWDLAVHDLAILYHLTGTWPTHISATGCDLAHTGVPTLAHIHLFYASGFMAHLYVNWMHPTKIRQITLTGQKKVIVFDDLRIEHKLSLYDKQTDSTQQSFTLTPPIHPAVGHHDALPQVFAHFADCCLQQRVPDTDCQMNAGIIQIVETIERALQSRRIETVDPS